MHFKVTAFPDNMVLLFLHNVVRGYRNLSQANRTDFSKLNICEIMGWVGLKNFWTHIQLSISVGNYFQ